MDAGKLRDKVTICKARWGTRNEARWGRQYISYCYSYAPKTTIAPTGRARRVPQMDFYFRIQDIRSGDMIYFNSRWYFIVIVIREGNRFLKVSAAEVVAYDVWELNDDYATIGDAKQGFISEIYLGYRADDYAQNDEKLILVTPVGVILENGSSILIGAEQYAVCGVHKGLDYYTEYEIRRILDF